MLSIDNEKNQKVNDVNTIFSEHKYNLYQQFYIIGLDPKLLFSIDKIDLKLFPEPYISPKIISKFPPNDLYYINIPDTVIASHCFPHGILNSIIEYNESNYETNSKIQTNFIFSLENQYPEEKNSSLRTNKLYYTCLLFYENVENYHECVEYKKKIFKSNKKGLYNGFAEYNNKGLLIPKVICLSSFKPFFEQSKLILENLKKYVDHYLYNKISKDNFNIYPIEKIIEGLIYNLPAIPRSNFILKLNKETFEPSYIKNNSKDENSSIINDNFTQGKNNNDEIIFWETPFNRQPKNVINYSILMKYFRIKEVFEIIKFILLEEPILFFCEDMHALTYIIEGLISLIYPLEYHYPVISVLPEQNYSFISIFKHFVFGINHKYTEEIFQTKGITLEDKKYIIIIKLQKRFHNILNSEEEDKLKYSVITSILSDVSKPLIKIEQNKMSDIDNSYKINNITENENIPEKRKLNLPMHYFEKCTKRLEKNTNDKFKEALSKSKNKKSLSTEEKENIFNNELRKTFIYFFSCILLRYQSFCLKFEKNIEVTDLNETYINKSNNSLDTTLITNARYNNNSIEEKDFDFYLERNALLEEKYLLNELTINDIFNSKNFIDDTDTPKLDRPFYRQFFETQVFFNFIKKKIFPNSLLDKLDILYFDYKVNEKLSRGSRKIKVETKFFSEDLENLSGEIKINSFKKEPSKKLREFLNDADKNCQKGINYFQLIANQNSIISNDKNTCENNSDYETMDTGICLISLHNVGSNLDDNGSSLNVTGKISDTTNFIDVDEDEEYNKNKLTFSYYVFPKLLNDDLFFKEDIFLEELGDEKVWLDINNKNDFNINNCKSLYNQFEKEANIFIKKPIIQQNYKIYDYNLNAKWKYKYKYEECISKLWLLYLAKTFHCIAFSKKRYYFEEIVMFLNDKQNKVDQYTIILLFNAINKYGDRYMNQELFMFLYKKNYINFLCLREKMKSENNFVKYISSQNKRQHLESHRDSCCLNPEDIISKIYSMNSEINKEKIKRKLFDFYVYSYCSPNLNENKNIDIDLEEENLINLDLEIKDNSQVNDNSLNCNEPLIFNIKDLFIYESNKKYIEIKCPKCCKKQNITITCIYTDDNNNKYQFNFNLVSPLALQKEPWFKNYNKLDTLYISKEYPEEYLSAMFYFYEQGLPCNFLIPKGTSEQILKKDRASTYNNIDPIDSFYYSRFFTHKKTLSLHTTRVKREGNLSKEKDRSNIFDNNTISPKNSQGRKSPSPKKSSLAKRSKFSQKPQNNDVKIKTKNVTFSCFKK